MSTYRYSYFDNNRNLHKNNIVECETLDILKSKLKAQNRTFETIEVQRGQVWEQVFPVSAGQALREQAKKEKKKAIVGAGVALVCFSLALFLLKRKD